MLSKKPFSEIDLKCILMGSKLHYNQDRMMAAELLALREQLAELKALEPIGRIVMGEYDSDGYRTAKVMCLHEQADWDNFQNGTFLFTAAKPAEE
ncbi:Uncharacterised protein [Yersinia nurmii]|uniref:Phage protein n=1 Tax=Yersinia nurmii TaxID=685706 RepID=A0ABM9SMU8_9GAMM|nr:hypothetical protein [Yersinia nurmii]CNF28037.1 Uncharacterised protein [Yersinia nurmii]